VYCRAIYEEHVSEKIELDLIMDIKYYMAFWVEWYAYVISKVMEL